MAGLRAGSMPQVVQELLPTVYLPTEVSICRNITCLSLWHVSLFYSNWGEARKDTLIKFIDDRLTGCSDKWQAWTRRPSTLDAWSKPQDETEMSTLHLGSKKQLHKDQAGQTWTYGQLCGRSWRNFSRSQTRCRARDTSGCCEKAQRKDAQNTLSNGPAVPRLVHNSLKIVFNWEGPTWGWKHKKTLT